MNKELNIKHTEVFLKNQQAYHNPDKRFIINQGGARCHAKGTEIIMYDGTIKKVEDIIIGDKVLHPNGKDYNTVLELHSGIDNLYKIKHKRTVFSDYVCNGNHILALKKRGVKQTGYQNKLRIVPKLTQEEKNEQNFISVNDYLNLSKNKQKFLYEELNSYIDYNEQELTIDPYYLGLQLGDGISSSTISVTIDKKETEIINHLKEYGKQYNLDFVKVKSDDYLYKFTDSTTKQNIISKLMSTLKIRNNKHIPEQYLKNSKTNRLKLLAGLIDSDGYNTGRNTYGITMIKKDLMLQIYKLIKSLGYYCRFAEYNASMKRKDGSIYNVISYRVEFNHYNFDELNKYLLTPRKKIIKNRDINKSIYHSRFDIIEEGIGEYYGFTLDGDNLFKLESGIIQHNSSKTYSILQILIVLALQNNNFKITVVRKALATSRGSVLIDLLDILKELKIYNEKNYSKSETIYNFDNGSSIAFIGADDDMKLRGRKHSLLYVNEANDLNFEEQFQLISRCEGKAFLDFNPSDDQHQLYDLINEDKSILIKSNYKDNVFLKKTQIEYYDNLINVDSNYYRIYALGEKPTSNTRVYNHFQKYIEIPQTETIIKHCYGLDFGYTHPNALVEIQITNTNKIYCKELLYESKLTSSELAEKVKILINGDKVFCDYSRPEIIKDLKNNKITAVNANKEVKQGINNLRKHEIFVHYESENLQKEYKNYNYKTVNGIITEEVIKEFDDLMDALRYAVHSTLGKNILSPQTKKFYY